MLIFYYERPLKVNICNTNVTRCNNILKFCHTLFTLYERIEAKAVKKHLTPLIFFAVTIIFCMGASPVTEVFKNYDKSHIKISPYGEKGCEISCRSKKGLVKKYYTSDIKPDCIYKLCDFNSDGIDDFFISDGEKNEIVNFFPGIPLKLSKDGDFSPLVIRFTKNENSVTGFLENGQTFEIFPNDINDTFAISKDAEIYLSDHDNNKVYEICITQQISNSRGIPLYTVNTYRTFNGRSFETKKIKITAVE